MKLKKLCLLLTCLVSATAFAESQFTPISVHSKKDGVSVGSQLITPCQKNFLRPRLNICVDSADGNEYPLSAQMSCTINPNAKNVPEWMKNYCNGQMQTYDPGNSDFVEVQVFDKASPPRMITNQVHIQMGMCSADFKNMDLSQLAGNIYSCDQATGKFNITKIAG